MLFHRRALALLLVPGGVAIIASLIPVSIGFTPFHRSPSAALTCDKISKTKRCRPRKLESARSRRRYPTLSVSVNNDDGDDGDDEKRDANTDFFDFLASKAAKVNEPSAAGEEGRRRRRDRVLRFLSDRGLGGGEVDMVEPIRVDGIEGMPGIDEILSENRSSAQDLDESGRAEGGTVDSDPNFPSAKDLADHPDDISRVGGQLYQFKSEVREQLAQQRASDPSSVPPNAEEFLDRIIEEVQEYNLAEAREQRAHNNIRSYEVAQKDKFEEESAGRDVGDDALVMEILTEAKGNADSRKADEAQVESFRNYEKAAREKADSAEIDSTAKDSEDIDEKALRIMEDLYAKRSEEADEFNEDSVEWDTDNLEDGISELRASIEERDKGNEDKIRPEDMTLTDWVKMRSIATRMADESGNMEIDEKGVESQLQSWKEYQAKEEDMRRNAGLTRGAQMPFPWGDKFGQNKKDNDSHLAERGVDSRHPDDIRADYDRQALQILSSLMLKTLDPDRRAKLNLEVQELKIELSDLEKKIEERGPWTPPEISEEGAPSGPLDVSDIFGQSMFMDEDAPVPTSNDSEPNVGTPDDPPPPPSTPFFSDSLEEDTANDEDLPSSQPPNTPFFSDNITTESVDTATEYDGFRDTNAEDEENEDEIKSLGSLDEQKFRSMTRRAGVRSEAGEDKLKKQWEEYTKAEQSMRDQSGLSGGDDPSLLRTRLNYDIDEMMKEGDVDADKILASIGQRPSKKKKSDTSAVSKDTLEAENEDECYQQFLQYEQQRKEDIRRAHESASDVSDEQPASSTEEKDSTASEDEDVIVYQKQATTWDKSSISDQLYRSLTPEASVRDDPEAKEKDKAAFREFLQKEEDMRKAVESMEVPVADIMGKVSFSDDGESESETFLDAEKVDIYIESALNEIGPRPKVRKRKKTDSDYARDYSDRTSQDADASEDLDDYDYDVPEWVKTERQQEEKRRSEASDDAELDDVDYETKQRQAEDFERKYSSESAEISIGNVLGRDYFGSSNEPDDFYSLDKGRGSSFSSFEKRKKTLLEYTELSVSEINSLIEYKESETATGVSRYMKKVQMPYREFGAIFRLEGLLVDIAGLQWEAWKQTSEEYDFDLPSLEEVRTASAHRAPYAIQRIFYWTDDIVEVRKVAETHNNALKAIFSKWMEDEGVTYTPAQGPKSFDMFGAEEDSRAQKESATPQVEKEKHVSPFTEDNTSGVPQPSESEFIGMHFRSWKKASEVHGYPVPTIDEMQVAMYTGPDTAVTKAFGWTSDPNIAGSIAESFRKHFRQETEEWAQQHPADKISEVTKERKLASSDDLTPTEVTKNHAENDGLSKEDMLEMQLFAWSTAAEKHNFVAPSLETVQMASWTSPVEAVQRVFNWSSDKCESESVALTFREAMKTISDVYIKKKQLDISSAAKESAVTEEPSNAAPTQDDIMRLHLDAWAETAKKYGFDAPSIEDIQLAAFGSPDEAVIRVFKWTEEIERSSEIATSFRETLKASSKKFLNRFSQSVGRKMTDKSTASNAQKPEDLPFFHVIDGAVNWIERLLDVEMGCAVVSHLDQELVDVILEQTGLDAYFPPDKRVSATNLYTSQSTEFLGAALRLERRPGLCAVFDGTPSSSAAAHEVDMQSVCKIGTYKNYDLLSAELTFKYFSELQTQILRGLFSERTMDQPQTEIQDIQPEVRNVATKVRYWEEGDRE